MIFFQFDSDLSTEQLQHYDEGFVRVKENISQQSTRFANGLCYLKSKFVIADFNPSYDNMVVDFLETSLQNLELFVKIQHEPKKNSCKIILR